VAKAREHSNSTRSQSSAKVPSSMTTSGVAHPGESVTMSTSQKCQPAAAHSASHAQQRLTVSPPTDQQMTSPPLPSSGTVEPLPPSGKQRLICSVEVPGIGRASRVSLVECYASCKVEY